jgi:hypothetical protein
MLASRQYQTQNSPDSFIPGFQGWAYEMYQFDGACFQMSPSVIGLKLNILSAKLKFLKGNHKRNENSQRTVNLGLKQPALEDAMQCKFSFTLGMRLFSLPDVNLFFR